MWERQLDAFADRYRVVAYDLRGYGQSDFPPRPYAHHRDLGQLLDALDIDSAHFVGASMGGAAVLDFALVHPDRAASLALVAPALSGHEFTDETTKTGWAEAGAAFEAGELERAATIESEIWLVGPSRTLDEVDADSRELIRSVLLRRYELQSDDAAEEGLQPPAVDRLDELSQHTVGHVTLDSSPTQVPRTFLFVAVDSPLWFALPSREPPVASAGRPWKRSTTRS